MPESVPTPLNVQRIFISTGDASGCQHALDVIEALRKANPTVEIAIIGDSRMENLPNVTLFRHHDAIGMGRFGFVQALQGLLSHASLLWDVYHFVKAWQPTAVLLIDYGGFHLQLLKHLAPLAPCYYYIPPQVWASRGGRTRVLQQYCQRVFTIFPFEQTWYDGWQVSTTFVGHPLAEQLPPTDARETFAQRHHLAATSTKRSWVGLFPGSRRSEVKALLPALLHGLALHHQHCTEAHTPPPLVLLAKASNLSVAFLETELDKARRHCLNVGLTPPELCIIEADNHALLSVATVILGASGTTSLEAALYGTPMIITYKTDAITAWLAKRLITVPFVGLPNLLASAEVAPILPELLQEGCTAEAIAEQLAIFCNEAHPQRQQALQALIGLRERLSSPDNLGSGEVISAYLLGNVSPSQ